MRPILIIIMVLLGGWLMPAAAHAAAPTVAITDPLSGALLSAGQPTVSGQASSGPIDTNLVTVNIYAGTSAANAPVEAVQSTVIDNHFSATASGLADGTYTAIATESDLTGEVGVSQPTTFQLSNAPALLTLTAPAAPIRTPAPVFTGTAQTGSGDGSSAYLVIYPGSGTDATPVSLVPGTVAPDGSFAIQVLPGLTAGTYTAVATQPLADGAVAYSPADTFTISGAAGVGIAVPASGASEPQSGALFSGVAGDAYGDAQTVDLSLYANRTGTGTPLGRHAVDRVGDAWSERWPSTLAVGIYTLTVSQTNLAGGVTTASHTFRVVAPGTVSGRVTISASGRLRARVACRAGAGACHGDVLIVTAKRFQPQAGGPIGPLSLLFSHYSVRAGASVGLSAQLTPDQRRALTRAGSSKLVITVVYPVGAKLATTSRETAAVRVG